jgi:hypothetical protein
MINFFRKIRKKLADDNKPLKYMRYAIGEIVLVMIGILLALQVNNWNEWRKDREKEKIILSDLADNIKINIQTLQNDIDLLQKWNHSSEIVIHVIETKLDYSDTLNQHFHLARVTKQDLFLSNIGYQAYKDEGLDILTNKTLSSEVIKLYEVTFPSSLSTNNLVNEMYPTWDNHIVQNFSLISGEGLTPNDYESLFSDHFYISWVKAYYQGRFSLIRTNLNLIKECERVLKLIHKELK